ncbi:uncharacterized protein FIBRA_01969 [Fibroporia radiculosa]|uniref:Haloacid dehalogenase n=1 Tax=Fibroporia radiculosa TaxID=599839 RepID=J4H1J9_9APHY|nr:uncharacterized protein FIBRA_01969 [Fibroporia radiculosa]CCL99944.1 predicted protein [Fibroporia radiculosa]
MSGLRGVKAFVFDVFGTVVDWRSSVVKQLRESTEGKVATGQIDWDDFASEWRAGYYKLTNHIANGGEGPSTIDEMYYQILNSMLDTPRWEQLAKLWNEQERRELVLFWHRLDGISLPHMPFHFLHCDPRVPTGWPDATKGLYALKAHAIIGTLSNGNVRLLVDMAKHADLPWDVVFAGDILGSYKPNPKMYLGALQYLALQPHECAMVAAHIYDLRAAASHGMKTVYIPRLGEDQSLETAPRSKQDGGEVDIIVNSLVELAEVWVQDNRHV